MALGAAAPATLMLPKPDNPLGFWESYRIMNLNDAILAAAGSDWKDWKAVDHTHLAGAVGEAFAIEAVTALESEFGSADTVVLKDPRICRLYPFWRKALEAAGYEPVVILPVRHPDKVARSLHERNGLPIEDGWNLWLRHVLDAERDSRQDVRMVATFDDFAASWADRFASLAAVSGVDLTLSDPHSMAEVNRFWARDVPSAAVAPDDSQLPGIISQAWSTLKNISKNGDTPENRFELNKLRADMEARV